eukprot:scaffold26465_cov176-Cylindrotheca_fusiformis.AAC.1
MLNDHVRNRLYDQAIQKASEQLHRSTITSTTTTTTITGLDIGSGTGLLAMLSAKYLNFASNNSTTTATTTAAAAAAASVTSLEMSSAMAQLAQRTISCNSHHFPAQQQQPQPSSIRILESHSCEMDPLPIKANFCTSELLESGLLAEGWLPTMRDAWERHLDSDAIVVPQRARVYAQIVQGDCLSNYWGPHKPIHLSTSTTSSSTTTTTADSKQQQQQQMKLWFPETNEYLLGSPTSAAGGGGVQIPIHAKQWMRAEDPNAIQILSDAIHILDFNVSSKDTIPPPEGQSQTLEFIPTSTGRAQAVLFWWELDLYHDNNDDSSSGLTYSTHPDAEFQDHWHQCLFVFTKPKDQCVELIQGKPAAIMATSDDSRIVFDVFNNNNSSDTATDEQGAPKRLKTASLDETGHDRISPDRAWQLNDLERSYKIRDGIWAALQEVGMKESIVLDVSDFTLGGIMAALLGASQVFSVESSSNSLPLTAAKLAQISNNLPLDKSNPNSFQILQCHFEQLTTNVLGEGGGGGLQPNIIVAEPYYEVLEGWHLAEALNFFYIQISLKKRGVIVADARSVPAKAYIQVCAMDSADLGRAYKHCDDDICGFDHSVVNASASLLGTSSTDIRIPAWEYDITPLTEAVTIATIDYENCKIIPTPVVQRAMPNSGTCHGMLIWVDYGIRRQQDGGGGGDMEILSTQGRSYQQL